ncbi:MAG: FAD-dependent oxidoreductase [Burkholderiaceae bacterium]
MKQLFLLGGGHAHVEVLRRIARSPLPATRVSLVSPRPQALYSGMVPGIVAGHYDAAECSIDLRLLAQQAGATWVQASACGIDAAANRMRLFDGGDLGYDVLSLDIGSITDLGSIAGAAQHGLPVRPIEDFARAVDDLIERAQRRFIGVVVVGGGAAAVELALALQFRLGPHARVTLVTGGTAPLPTFPQGTQARARHALRRLAVRVIEDSVLEIGARQLRLAQGEGLACDAAVLAVGASPAPWLRASGLQLDAAGFVATGASLQSLSHPNVYAVGDIASRPDAPRPRSGVYAVRAGAPLAENLRRTLTGEAPLEHRPGKRALNLLACGGRHAIASWGAWSAEGRWVWWWKDRIDRRFIARYR